MSTSLNNGAVPTAVSVKEAAQEATKLLASAIGRILDSESSKASGDGPGTRILFPNGIELIYLAFKVGNDINISLAVAGKDAPVKVPVTIAARSSEDGSAGPAGGWVSAG